MGPLTIGEGAGSDSRLPLDPFHLAGLPGWASVGEEVLSPAGTRCPRVGQYPRGSSLSMRQRASSNRGRDL